MTDKDGGTAFPVVHPDGTGVQYFGMSLRDYFAAKAMLGFMSNPIDGIENVSDMANASYVMAEAMLAARGAK